MWCHQYLNIRVTGTKWRNFFRLDSRVKERKNERTNKLQSSFFLLLWCKTIESPWKYLKITSLFTAHGVLAGKKTKFIFNAKKFEQFLCTSMMSPCCYYFTIRNTYFHHQHHLMFNKKKMKKNKKIIGHSKNVHIDIVYCCCIIIIILLLLFSF